MKINRIIKVIGYHGHLGDPSGTDHVERITIEVWGYALYIRGDPSGSVPNYLKILAEINLRQDFSFAYLKNAWANWPVPSLQKRSGQ
jgi:hypothetical protein